MNHICHIEFSVTDLDRSQAFYGGVFGWSFREFMGGTMRVFSNGNDHIGGLMKADSVIPGASPSLWFQVDSLEQKMGLATAKGGSVVGEKHEVPGVGWSAQVADPDGNLVGMVEYTSPQ